MKVALLCLSATILVCIAGASSAFANHVTCGDVITQDTTLDSDLVNCPDDGVVIGADNIKLDLAGHTIDGVGGQAGGAGVDNEGYDGVEVRRGRIQQFHAGVYFDFGDEGLLRGLTITDSGAAFQLWDSDFNTIERNVLSTGIALYADSDSNTIDRNTTSGAGTHVLVFGFGGDRVADGNRITRNRMTGAGLSYAIYAGFVNDTVIEGNQIRGHSGIGISVNAQGLGNRIQGNTVSGTGEGIALDSAVRDTSILRNQVTNSARDGIRLGSMTVNTVVERNNASRNGDDGIDSDSSSATITGNTAKRNFDLGIEAVTGVTDGGGNRASGNGNPAQCVGVSCS